MTQASSPSPSAQTYTVRGMTCAHCVASVTEEVDGIEGVDRVDVELETGRVVVYGEDFTDADVRAAVTEAGYELAP